MDGVCNRNDKACEATVPSTSVANAKSRLDKAALYETKLTPINCSFGRVKLEEDKKLSLQSACRKERDKSTSCIIAYVLRHPACGPCREKGKVLSEFVSNDNSITFFTVVKEAGIVDTALVEYYVGYGNRNPVYQDPQMGIYKAMGGRKVKIYDMARGVSKFMWRSRKTKVVPNFREVTKGDLWTQGGVLIFDRKGQLAHIVYEPQFGKELDMGEIATAVEKVKKNSESHA